MAHHDAHGYTRDSSDGRTGVSRSRLGCLCAVHHRVLQRIVSSPIALISRKSPTCAGHAKPRPAVSRVFARNCSRCALESIFRAVRDRSRRPHPNTSEWKHLRLGDYLAALRKPNLVHPRVAPLHVLAGLPHRWRGSWRVGPESNRRHLGRCDQPTETLAAPVARTRQRCRYSFAYSRGAPF